MKKSVRHRKNISDDIAPAPESTPHRLPPQRPRRRTIPDRRQSSIRSLPAFFNALFRRRRKAARRRNDRNRDFLLI